MVDILTYLRNIIASESNLAIVDPDLGPKKLVAKDTENTIKNIEDSKINEEKLLNVFPKKMNWLNWKDKGFRDALLDAQVWTESRGNPNAVGPMTSYGQKAVGLTQFMPETWKGAKKRGWISPDAKRTDPKASLKAQKEYMSHLYNLPEMDKSTSLEDRLDRTLASYNYGIGNVRKAVIRADVNGTDWKNELPRETKKYIDEIKEKTGGEYFKYKENYVSQYIRD